MFKNKVFILLAAAAPFFANAQNGYWEERQVCDYEQVVIEAPKTNCYFSGYVYAISPGQVANGHNQLYHSYLVTLNNHVNCQSFSQFHGYLQTRLSDGSSGAAVYEGYLPLSSQTHINESTVQTIVVPGSCRTERVWIPLCDRCQIP